MKKSNLLALGREQKAKDRERRPGPCGQQIDGPGQDDRSGSLLTGHGHEGTGALA